MAHCRDFSSAPYPGEYPPYDYAVIRGEVVPVQLTDSGLADRIGLDIAASLATHIPLLTYGSNACPGRMVEKFGDDAERLHGILVFRAMASNLARAWCARPASSGVLPYTIVGAADETEVHVVLLPRHLISIMDESEGRGASLYVVGRLTECEVRLPDGQTWQRPLTYIGTGKFGPLVIDGKLQRPETISREDLDPDLARGRNDDCLLPPYELIPPTLPLTEVVDFTGADAALAALLQR